MKTHLVFTERHDAAVLALACAPIDGRMTAVTAGADGTVRVWDLISGRERYRLTGHVGPVWTVDCLVLPGRSLVVSGGDDGTVRSWNLATGQPLALARHEEGVTSLACSVGVDGPVVSARSPLAWAYDGEGGYAYGGWVQGWHPLTGEAVGRPLQVKSLGVVAGQANGRLVAVSDHETVRLCPPGVNVLGGPEFKADGRGCHDGESRGVKAMAWVCGLNDGALAIATPFTAWLWQPWSEALAHQPVFDYTDDYAMCLRAFACMWVGERALMVAAHQATSRSTDMSRVQCWDLLGHGQAVGRPLLIDWDDWDSAEAGAPDSGVLAIACTELAGRAVAVLGCGDGSVRVWPLPV